MYTFKNALNQIYNETCRKPYLRQILFMLNIIAKYSLMNTATNIHCVEVELLAFFGFTGKDTYCNERCDGSCS